MEKASRRKRRNVSRRSSIQLKTRRLVVERPEDSASPASSGNSCVASGVSCCSGTRSSERAEEITKFTDLEATSGGQLVDFRDCYSLFHFPKREKTAEKMPTEAELEEFFGGAEANLQKQFIDKYNYDIVKEEALEGRYEWIQIQLNPRSISSNQTGYSSTNF